MTNDQSSPPERPFLRFPGKIHLITTDEQLSLLTGAFEGVREIGFDTETRPSFRKGEVYQVALLQLATEDDAYLIRLHGIRNFDSIKAVLEDESLLKTGVAIRDDLKGLQKLFRFVPQNFVELQDLAKKCGLKNFGLKGMTEEVLNAALSKAAKITNWEARTLTEAQLLYAATDAWVGLKIYQNLTSAAPEAGTSRSP